MIDRKTRGWTKFCHTRSSYVDEGRIILSEEFGRDYGVYFSILSAVASGKTSFAEIQNVIGAEIRHAWTSGNST